MDNILDGQLQMIDDAAQMLIAGKPGHEVMDYLRRTFVNEERDTPRCLSGLNSTMSLVRSAVIARGVRDPSYDDRALRTYAGNAEIASFLGAPLAKQCKLQRAHAALPSWGDAAETALSALQILPASMNTFKLSKGEALQLKIDQEQAQMRKNEDLSIIRIDDAPHLLKMATWLLETAHPTDTYARLILPLLLCTGRRLTEICGGKSAFAPVEGRPMYAEFSGQLKKGGAAEAYIIPLLCEYQSVAKGWLALQQRQQVKGSKKRGAEATLSNKEAAKRYQGNTDKYLQKGTILPLPKYGQKKGSTEPKACHAHDLRSIYMAFVYELFDCPDTFNRTCMRVLGHVKLAESLSYNNVRLGGMASLRHAYGALDTSRTDSLMNAAESTLPSATEGRD